MKPTLTLSWKAFGFAAMILLAALLAIMPSRLAGASLENRLADVAAQMPAGGYTVKAGALADWIVSGKSLTLVDVREHWEYDEFHIEGAGHTPLQQLVSPNGVKALAAGTPVVVIGRDDAGPAQAAAMLRLAGLEAYVLEGGMKAWWRDVLMPASIDTAVPDADKPTVAAQRLRWRARFLGDAAAGTAPAPGLAATPSTPVPRAAPAPGTARAPGAAPAPAAPPPPAPAPAKSGATRGKGC